LAIIIAISLGRSWYSSGITEYYALFLMKEASMEFQNAQWHVFVYKSYIANRSKIHTLEGNMVHIGDKKLPIEASYKEEVLKKVFE